MILIKRGVVIANLSDERILEPAYIADKLIWSANGWGDVTITGGIDGNHLPNSQHYKGTGLDLRLPSKITKDTNHDGIAILELRRLLPEWKFILEKDHIHCQRG